MLPTVAETTPETEWFRSHDGVEIAFSTHGPEAGEPIVLVHGFASSRKSNWDLPGWTDRLARAGRRVVALDCRGHGQSEKLHEPAAYGSDRMPRDVVALMDHLDIPRADLMGYSMGGRISAWLLVEAGDRFVRGVLAGVGGGLFAEAADRRRGERIAEALLADDPADVADPGARGFRLFADQQGADRRALAACMRGMRRSLGPEDAGRITAPVLVVVGRDDTLVGDPNVLASAIPGAQVAIIEGRDHLTAVPARATKQVVFDFLGISLPGAPGRAG